MARSTISDDELRRAAAGARHMSELLSQLGLVAAGSNYEVYRDRLHALGLMDRRFAPGGGAKRPMPPDEVVHEVWEGGVRSTAQLIAGLHARGFHATYPTVRAAEGRLGLDLQGLPGQSWSRGKRLPRRPRTPLAEVLVRGRRFQGGALRRRLVAEGLKRDECEGCLGHSWCGGPIPLELDHINGHRWDNRLENLRLLCPNCHALTHTYRGRNIGRGGQAGPQGPAGMVAAHDYH